MPCPGPRPVWPRSSAPSCWPARLRPKPSTRRRHSPSRRRSPSSLASRPVSSAVRSTRCTRPSPPSRSPAGCRGNTACAPCPSSGSTPRITTGKKCGAVRCSAKNTSPARSGWPTSTAPANVRSGAWCSARKATPPFRPSKGCCHPPSSPPSSWRCCARPTPPAAACRRPSGGCWNTCSAGSAWWCTTRPTRRASLSPPTSSPARCSIPAAPRISPPNRAPRSRRSATTPRSARSNTPRPSS